MRSRRDRATSCCSSARPPAETGSAAQACWQARSSTSAPRTSGPAVQVGDPFEEKLLIEACLELLEKGLLVGLGDCGAAGMTSSISEMASRGGVGVDIDAGAVPQREDAMKPFEIMVSESQERMVAVVEPEKLEARRWASARSGGCARPSSAPSPTPAASSYAWAMKSTPTCRPPHSRTTRPSTIRSPPGPPTSTRSRRSTRSRSSSCPTRPSAWARSSSACWRAPTSARGAGSGSSTTTRS